MGTTWRAVLAAFGFALFMHTTVNAQFLTSPQPGDVYKEFVKPLVATSDWRVTHSATTNPSAQVYLPNATLSLNIGDLNGAVRAEAIMDVWGGHIGTSNLRFRFNNNAWINIPKLGAGNGIPAGTDGYCYIYQYNPVVPIPLSHLVQGNNTFKGDCDNQLSSALCLTSFNWGQWGWMGVIVRVYYNSSKPHPTGSITSPTASGVIGENPTVTATTSGSVAQVDFLAYYDGVDYDGDGVYQEYHHSYHRGKTETTFSIKNHVGTKTTAPYTVTWNTDLVPNQGGIKLKALIKGTDGTFFVTNEVTGLTLQRTGTVILCKATNVPRRFWVRGNFGEATSKFTIPAGTNLANATSAKLAIATWNGIDGAAEPGETHYMRVNNYTLPDFGENHHYSWNAITVPINQLVVGINTFKVFSNSSHHGIEVLWPGPSLVLRLSTGGGPVAPTITQHPADQSVSPGQTATFSVQATGTAPLSYQWQKNNVDIEGATNPSYTTPPTTLDDNGSTFKCIVSNSQGNAASNAATLTVGYFPPVITQHPSNQSVNVGQTATFSVAATGTLPFTYQWQRDNVDIDGATSASYTTPATVLTDSGSTYRCVVTNVVTSVNSNTATLSVNEPPPPSANVLSNPGFESGTSGWSFYTNGTGAFAAAGPGYSGNNAARLTLTTVGNNMQLFQTGFPLEANTAYTLSFVAYSSAGRDLALFLQRHDSPFTNYGLNNRVANLTTGWQTFTFQFTTTGFSGTVTNGRLRFVFNGLAAAGDIYYIDNVVLSKTGSVATPPAITTHPADQTVVEGSGATFSVVATGTAPLSYQWQKNNVDIAGATTASYTTPAASLADNGASFRCRVSNGAGNVLSNVALLTVTPAGAQNVINNPGFESGTTSWSFYTNGTGNFVAASPGFAGSKTARLTLTTIENNIQLFQTGFPLEANTSYTLSFVAYSSSGRDLSVFLQRHDSPYTSYGLNNRVANLTTGWQTFSFQFTTTGFSGTVTNGRLRFVLNGLAAAGDVYYIDNVVLSKTNTTPLPPVITQHPVNRAVAAGQTATFSVVVTGTPPLSYQWQKNTVDIPEAVSASYSTPVTTLADDGASFRCIVSNAGGSVTSNAAILNVGPPGASDWWNDQWIYRLPVEVNVGAFTRTEKPVELALNFTEVLNTLGVPDPFNDNSIRVIEVNETGAILDEAVVFQFERDATYNASTNASGNLVFLLGGNTAQNGIRYFDLYFDVSAGFSAPSFPNLVNYTDNVLWEGQASYQVSTPRATYYYHKQGAGFASMIDNNGNDWISYHPGGGSAGEYRGIPNLGDVFHPGYTNSTSSIAAQGPIRIKLRSTSTDAAWESFWHIYPTYAHMTLTKKGSNYWFLYEGTPGGSLSTTTDFMYRSSGTRTTLGTSWFGDLAAPEWVYFGDAGMKRTLFVIHHENDTQPDYFRQMENNMTVFGFGRQDPCCTRYMTAIPQNFTIGFAEDSAFAATSTAINAAYQPVEVLVSEPETRPALVPPAVASGGAANELPTEYGLSQNYPNPFNPTTIIRFQLPEKTRVRISLYDVLGRLVRVLVDEERVAGIHETVFDAGGLSSGIYLYRIETGGFVAIRRLTLLK